MKSKIIPFAITLASSVLHISAEIVILPGGLPKPYTGRGPVRDANALFRESITSEFTSNEAQVLFSSYDYPEGRPPLSAADAVLPSADSFVRGAIQAWGEHLHLVLRPEEIWFTILTQMNFYMEANAEAVRDLFVAHEGRETIVVEDRTWWRVLIRFQDEIQDRVKTEWLRDWIVPRFTTTTENDVMTANILMMGLTKAYFRFEGGIICGLPSVTLLGEKEDWEEILMRLERLSFFGAEPAAYADRLRPILLRFVRSFDDPDSADTKAFWNGIVSARSEAFCGAPPFYLSGWIVGFFYWTDEGRPYARDARGQESGDLVLDGVAYPSVDIGTLPVGYASAPFVMLDFNFTARYEAYVLAGTIGKRITRGAPAGYSAALDRIGSSSAAAAGGEDGEGHATLTPLSSWVLLGPKSHNATRPQWQREVEIQELIGSVDVNFEEGECGTRGGGIVFEPNPLPADPSPGPEVIAEPGRPERRWWL